MVNERLEDKTKKAILAEFTVIFHWRFALYTIYMTDLKSIKHFDWIIWLWLCLRGKKDNNSDSNCCHEGQKSLF